MPNCLKAFTDLLRIECRGYREGVSAMAYDEKCEDLARYFLPFGPDEKVRELAQLLQNCVEFNTEPDDGEGVSHE